MDNASSPAIENRDNGRNRDVQSTCANDEASFLFPNFYPCRSTPYPEVTKDQKWPMIEEEWVDWHGRNYRRWVYKPSVFPYSRLPPGRSIRLIRLQSGQEDRPLSASLVTANIDHGVQYEAISYVWGDDGEGALIFLDGTPIKVTINLYQALKCVRSPVNERVLWVDAICINQDDHTERSAQVQMMRDIYEHAQLVLVWLGPKDGEDEVAIAFINRLAGRYSLSNNTRRHNLLPLAESIPVSFLPDPDSNEWASLFRFFELPYFCRTWIIQEIQANDNCVVLCGQCRTTFLAIELAAFCAFRAPEAVRDKMITDRGISNVMYIRNLAAPNTSLMTRLEQTRGFFATDPRDKIFAFLRQQDLLVPDYAKCLTDVLLCVSRQILEEEGLDALSHVFHESIVQFIMKRTSLPSWTPTFRNCFIVPLYKICGLAAGGPSTSQDFTVENKKLKMKAIFLDRIAIIHPSLSWDDLSVTPSVRNIPTYVDRLWHLYSGAAKARTQYLSTSYSIQAAFSMVITAGLARWGLEPEPAAHERVFLEFTKLLFGRAGHIEARLRKERSHQDGRRRSNAMDLVGDHIKHINYSGGGQASYNHGERPEYNNRKSSELMPSYQRFQRAAQSVCNSRCVFQTQSGYLGLGPSVIAPRSRRVRWDEENRLYPEVRVDESDLYEVWIPLGGKTPFILKPCGSSYIMAGECYVQGVMDGEVLSNKKSRGQEINIGA